MAREYLRVTPTTSDLSPDVISTTLASLYKLSTKTSGTRLDRIPLTKSVQPVTFEFNRGQRRDGRTG